MTPIRDVMPSRGELAKAVREAYFVHGASLGRDVTDEQAVPSYVEGWWLSRFFFWGKLAHIVRAAAPAKGETLVDFGCGTGLLLPTWSAAGCRVFATDLHLQMAKHLARRQGLHDVRFVAPDKWTDEVPDGSANTVVAANVLEHVEERPALYGDFARKLASDGKLVVSGPTENGLYRFGRRLIGFSGHYHVTTIKDLFGEIEAAGFVLRSERHYPVPGPGCLYRIGVFSPPR